MIWIADRAGEWGIGCPVMAENVVLFCRIRNEQDVKKTAKKCEMTAQVSET